MHVCVCYMHTYIHTMHKYTHKNKMYTWILNAYYIYVNMFTHTTMHRSVFRFHYALVHLYIYIYIYIYDMHFNIEQTSTYTKLCTQASLCLINYAFIHPYVCMYICMYVYVCMYVNVCLCMSMCVCIYIYICECVYSCVCLFTYWYRPRVVCRISRPLKDLENVCTQIPCVPTFKTIWVSSLIKIRSVSTFWGPVRVNAHVCMVWAKVLKTTIRARVHIPSNKIHVPTARTWLERERKKACRQGR